MITYDVITYVRLAKATCNKHRPIHLLVFQQSVQIKKLPTIFFSNTVIQPKTNLAAIMECMIIEMETIDQALP